jgi:hypothetical protein
MMSGLRRRPNEEFDSKIVFCAHNQTKRHSGISWYAFKLPDPDCLPLYSSSSFSSSKKKKAREK